MFRSEQAKQAMAADQAVTAMLLALEGLPDARSDDPVYSNRPYVTEAEEALYGALQTRREQAIMPGGAFDMRGRAFGTRGAAFSPDSSRILSIYWSTARSWSAEATRSPSSLDTDELVAWHFADGGRIVTASKDKRHGSGMPTASLATLSGHRGDLSSAVFSPTVVNPDCIGPHWVLWRTTGTAVEPDGSFAILAEHKRSVDAVFS
jgi:hypothetical protein